jgi:hypothetical protein
MEQHCQLSSHGNYRSLLGIFPSSLRKLQPPSPQITFPVRVYQTYVSSEASIHAKASR